MLLRLKLVLLSSISLLLNSMTSVYAAGLVYTDPHEYCRAVGKIANPEQDDRYRGPKATEQMAAVFGQKLADIKVVSADGLVNYTVTWRCASGEVFACWEPNNPQCGIYGSSRIATLDMTKWCRQNPNSGIPLAVTGHNVTIFDWNCVGKKPVAGRQYIQLDSEGYDKDAWKRVR